MDADVPMKVLASSRDGAVLDQNLTHKQVIKELVKSAEESGIILSNLIQRPQLLPSQDLTNT